MKLVQKILSHGLLIAFIVAAFFAYTNRAKLFPQWFGKTEKVAQQAADEKPDVSPHTLAERKVSRPMPEKTVSKKPVAPLDETTRSTAEEATMQPVPAQEAGELKTPLPSEPEEADVVQQAVEPRTAAPVAAPAVIADSPEQVQQEPQVPQVQPEVAGSAEGQTPGGTAETQDEVVEAESAEPQVATVPESAAVPQQTMPQQTDTAESATTAKAGPVTSAETDVTAVQAASGDPGPMPASPQQAVPAADAQLEKQLEKARQHYWQRDMEGAAAAYRALSEAYPQNPDVWGEMGNFYFNQRQREPAGAAYARCIELLIDQGEPVRARQLLNVLYRLDALKARELETRMQQVGG